MEDTLMNVDWWTIVGLVGLVLVATGSNVLVDFREWCKGFINPWNPLRWLGVTMEFVGMMTDKSMAAAFLLGLVWWSGPLPWAKVLVLSGMLVIATALADQMLALLHGMTVKLMGGGGGGGPAAAPFPIPRSRGRAGGEPPPPDRMPVEGRLPTDRPLTEEEAFSALDAGDDGADVDRGALVRLPAGDRR